MKLLNIITTAPFIITEMPDKYSHKKMIKHLTILMNELGLRQKDVVALDLLSGPEYTNEHPVYKKEAEDTNRYFTEALNGEKRFVEFYLYRYTDENGFVLLREPLEKLGLKH